MYTPHKAILRRTDFWELFTQPKGDLRREWSPSKSNLVDFLLSPFFVGKFQGDLLIWASLPSAIHFFPAFLLHPLCKDWSMNLDLKDKLKLFSSLFISSKASALSSSQTFHNVGGKKRKRKEKDGSATDAILSRSLGNILTCAMFTAQHLK